MDIALGHQNWRDDTAHTIVIFLYFWKGTTCLVKVSLVQFRCDGCKVYDSMKLEESRRFFHPDNFFFTPGCLQVMLNVAKLVCGQAPTFVQLQLLKLRLTSLSSRSNTGLVVFGTRYSPIWYAFWKSICLQFLLPWLHCSLISQRGKSWAKIFGRKTFWGRKKLVKIWHKWF